MTEFPSLVLVFAAGALLGVVYFLALWWTVQAVVHQRGGGLLLLLSWIARATVVLLGFVFVAGGDWRRLTACLLGFTASRIVIVPRIGHASRDEGGGRCT